ncbi:MAG: hypothetical protein IKJ77_09365 [Firmicutes bacterium]|nr:hypothetical protein [Bacillota bacterium]
MSLNHHILTKTTTDAILSKFKTLEWSYGEGKGKDFYRVGTSAEFPSPDATFYDPSQKVMASFEFKPPTETKRGILTGVGQSIAYLQSSNISFLIAPKKLQDYDLEGFLRELYLEQISGKIPAGLVLYDNERPSEVELACSIDFVGNAAKKKSVPDSDRFWAKHQDLPIPLFHLILHYYYLKRIRAISGDPFAECFKNEFITSTIQEDLTCKGFILDLSGQPIKTVAGTKNIVFFEKIIETARSMDREAAYNKIMKAIDTTFVGDNYYNSIRKNYLSFMKHIQVIDSENTLTEKGFALYHLGLVNGPNSKVFVDYFIKELLTTGHHLDLILDLDTMKQAHSDWSMETILTQMEIDYEHRGLIKRNPNRQQAVQSKVKFLKYERILWNALGLVDNNNTIQWKKITEICSLGDL